MKTDANKTGIEPEPRSGSLDAVVSWLAWINHKLDMLAYRIWWWRWRKKFVQNPRMLIPFMDTMSRWAEKELTADQIEECRMKWRSINKKPANADISDRR